MALASISETWDLLRLWVELWCRVKHRPLSGFEQVAS